jgi:transposase
MRALLWNVARVGRRVSRSGLATRSAIVAVARKLLVALWHVLTEQEADTHAHIEAVTRKLMNWMAHIGTTPGKKRDRLLLLYEQLDRLGLSEEVEQIDYYGSTYRLSTKQKLIRATQHRKET